MSKGNTITPKLSNQQVLLASLPKILKDSNEYFSVPPTRYIRTTEVDTNLSPTQKLTKLEKQEMRRILEMTNIELGSLVPKIQLWKIYTNENGQIVDEIYMPYSQDSRNYIEDIFGNRQSRGDDVGIQGVTFTYDQQDPAVSDRLLNCSVNFVLGNAEALVKDRGEGFRYADMLAWNKTEVSDSNDKKYYEIVLKVGYELDGITELISYDLRDALRTQEKMYTLGLTGYDLQFDPDGKLNIQVQYSSANMEYFGTKKNEILGLKDLLAAPEADPEYAKADELKPQIDKISLYKKLGDYMLHNDMIRVFKTTELDILLGLQENKALQPDCEPKNDYISDAAAEANKNSGPPMKVKEQLSKINKKDYTVTYFYFGDLIEAVLRINPRVYTEMVGRRYGIVLDNTGYQYIKGQKISAFNIAKLPIATSAWDDWFQKNVIDKNINIFPLMSFLKNVVQNFVTSILGTRPNDQEGSDYKPNIVRQIASIPDGFQDNNGIYGLTSLKTKPRNYFFSKSARDSYHEYYIIYDEKYYEDKHAIQMELISEEDRYDANLDAGIPHFLIGADKGLLKGFSFQKVDFGESLAVVKNFEYEGNPLRQLWTIFDVSVELVGNNLLSVGNTIYLDPTIGGLGSPFKQNTVSNLMGLGGYYMVQSINHTYYPNWTTSVTATGIIPASKQEAYNTRVEFEYY